MAEPLMTPSGSRWLPGDKPPEGHRAALYRLAAALRECTELLMDTEAPEDELLAAAEAAERFSAQLAKSAPRNRPLWGFAESSNSGDTHAHFDSSPVMGLGNPIAPPLHLAVVGDHVEGSATFGTAYEGPPGHVHGGIIAAAFDEVLGMTQSLTTAPGMTGTLSIRYLKPTPLHQEVHFKGCVDRRDGRKIYTKGSLTVGGVVRATAEGLFISVDLERMRSLADDRS